MAAFKYPRFVEFRDTLPMSAGGKDAEARALSLTQPCAWRCIARGCQSEGQDIVRNRMAFELPGAHRGTGLVDVLDRVLDKGLVIAGDIKVSLAEVELLTIRIRLLVCSLDKAQEIGLDWWRYDRELSPGAARRALSTKILRAEIRTVAGTR